MNHNGEDESVGNAEAIESVECARGNTVSPSSGDEDTRDFEDEAEQHEASDMAKTEREMRYLNKTERAASDMGKAERVEGDFDETKRVQNDMHDITSTFESQLLSLKHEATTAKQRQHRWRVIGIALVFIALWLVRLRFRGLPEDVPESLDHLVTWPQRQRRVVDAFEHAWKGYRRFGWGSDQVNVVTGTSNEWMYCGLTIVDSLDTVGVSSACVVHSHLHAHIPCS